MDALVSAPHGPLLIFFKPVSKSLPDPVSPLSKTLSSATIKAANEPLFATLKQPKSRSDDA